jgi:hypothetical protein
MPGTVIYCRTDGQEICQGETLKYGQRIRFQKVFTQMLGVPPSGTSLCMMEISVNPHPIGVVGNSIITGK